MNTVSITLINLHCYHIYLIVYNLKTCELNIFIHTSLTLLTHISQRSHSITYNYKLLPKITLYRLLYTPNILKQSLPKKSMLLLWNIIVVTHELLLRRTYITLHEKYCKLIFNHTVVTNTCFTRIQGKTFQNG